MSGFVHWVSVFVDWLVWTCDLSIKNTIAMIHKSCFDDLLVGGDLASCGNFGALEMLVESFWDIDFGTFFVSREREPGA